MGRTLDRIADDVARLPAVAAARAAEEVAEAATDEARRATGDGRMSGMGRRGPRLRGVVAQTKHRSRSTTATVVGVPAGAWAILDSGASPHAIRPRRGGGILVGRSMIHPVRGPIRHPGSRGRHTWARVTAQARRIAPDVVEDAVHKAVR